MNNIRGEFKIALTLSLAVCASLLVSCSTAVMQPCMAEDAAATTQEKSVAENATEPASRSDDGWMAKHDKLVKQVADSHCKIAFFGDSITEGINVDLLHKIIGADASNFGIGGDRTQHLLWRMRNGEMDFPAPGPEAFVVLIGTNNISKWTGKASNTNHEIYEGVDADLKEMRKRFPKAKILLLAMLPRDEKANTEVRKRVNETNELLKGLADRKHIWYLDITNALVESDGSISPKVMSDFLHPTKDEGYQRMFTAIKPHLDEMMKSSGQH